MPKLSHQLAFLALAFWLLGNWLGAHGHFCFGGQEPPVSVHMHMLGDHPEHQDDEAHQDADMDLLQSAIAKLTKLDQGLILLALAALLLVLHPQSLPGNRHPSFLPFPIAFTRPPLRAPPLAA